MMAERQARTVARLRVLVAILLVPTLVIIAIALNRYQRNISSWQPLPGFPRDNVSSIAFSSHLGAYVLCAGTLNVGVGCSLDGNTWNIYQRNLPTGAPGQTDAIAMPGTVRGIGRLAIDDSDSAHFVAFVWRETWEGDFYQSRDGGISWQILNVDLPTSPVVDLEVSGDLISVLQKDRNENYSLRVSTNGGNAWRNFTDIMTDTIVIYDAEILLSPGINNTKTLLLATETGVFQAQYVNNAWHINLLFKLPSARRLAQIHNYSNDLFVVTYDRNENKSSIYYWRPNSLEFLATYVGKLLALTSDPDVSKTFKSYILLDNQEVKSVSTDGLSISLGRRPVSFTNFLSAPFDLSAVPAPDGGPTWLLMGHTDGLLVFTGQDGTE